MSTLLLPPATRAVVRYTGPRPEATHVAWIHVEWRYRGEFHQEIIGCVAYFSDDLNDQDSRWNRWRRRINIRIPLGCSLRAIARDRLSKERRTLSDLQRFKRKMGMVLREYEKEKAAIERLERGIPQLAMERLDAELEEAWKKAERIYGHTQEDFDRSTH